MERDDYKKIIEDQGFNIKYNPPGDGFCQFAAVAHQLSALGLFRSPETMCEEIVSYLENNAVDDKGFSAFGVSSRVYVVGRIFRIHVQM